jgi:hypothetical protein
MTTGVGSPLVPVVFLAALITSAGCGERSTQTPDKEVLARDSPSDPSVSPTDLGFPIDLLDAWDPFTYVPYPRDVLHPLHCSLGDSLPECSCRAWERDCPPGHTCLCCEEDHSQCTCAPGNEGTDFYYCCGPPDGAPDNSGPNCWFIRSGKTPGFAGEAAAV